MAKETLKAKIVRLELEKKADFDLIQKLNKIISSMGEKADQDFENSGYKKQLEQQLAFQTAKAEVYEKQTQQEENRNSRLRDQIKELSSENERLRAKLDAVNTKTPKPSHNERKAGRKRAISEKQIAEIQMLRAQGFTLQAIEKETQISYGLVQKYCKIIKN